MLDNNFCLYKLKSKVFLIDFNMYIIFFSEIPHQSIEHAYARLQCTYF